MYVTSKYTNRRINLDMSESRARTLHQILANMESAKSSRWNDTFEQMLDGLTAELGALDEEDYTGEAAPF